MSISCGVRRGIFGGEFCQYSLSFAELWSNQERKQALAITKQQLVVTILTTHRLPIPDMKSVAG